MSHARMVVPVLLLVGHAPSAAAYLDPSSGSLLFASLFGIIATGFFFLKSTYYKLSSLVGRGKAGGRHTYGVVFYAEGSQYWSTFQPLIASLYEQGQSVTYLTSDAGDVAFGFAHDGLTVHYIGQGTRAFARLNFLNADVCVLTTPGLDVLQIKRSKGVDRYVHVVHSAMDAHTYKLFSFDYFDVILCSGQHQIDSIRELEGKRGTPSKTLLLTGCLYYDELVRKRDRLPVTVANPPVRRVLLAPTWGKNGLLRRYGARVIEALLQAADLEITIRPHPQSSIVEQGLLADLERRFRDRPNVTWDHAPDNFSSLGAADIMISDISGVMFDYVFLFERPVITIAFEPDWLGTEAFDLDTGAFELTVLDAIGRRVVPEDIASLPRIIEEVSGDRRTAARIGAIRAQMAVNFGHAGQVAAGQVLALGLADRDPESENAAVRSSA